MTRGRMPCTICGQDHAAASCTSDMAISSIRQSGNFPATAGRNTDSTEKRESIGSTGAPEDTDSYPLAQRYSELVDTASEALGSKRAVCEWLGLTGHGTLHKRLATPESIKREHVIALEVLVERLSGPPR